MTEHKQGTLLNVRDALNSIIEWAENSEWWTDCPDKGGLDVVNLKNKRTELEELIASVPDKEKLLESMMFVCVIGNKVDGRVAETLETAKILSEAVREE